MIPSVVTAFILGLNRLLHLKRVSVKTYTEVLHLAGAFKWNISLKEVLR